MSATTMLSRPSTEPLLPVAILAAEIGSLRRPDASRRPCVRQLPTRSSLRDFRAPLKGSKVSVHSSLPLSVPRRGNLLLSCQRDKRSKTASAFFVLGTQRNPNQRKVIHSYTLRRIVGLAYNLPQAHRTGSRNLSAQGFAADLRTQPRLLGRFARVVGWVLCFFPSRINIPPRRGNSKIFAMRRFWSHILRLDGLGAKHRNLSYADRRSAGASLCRLTKTPLLPLIGGTFFRKERSKGHLPPCRPTSVRR